MPLLLILYTTNFFSIPAPRKPEKKQPETAPHQRAPTTQSMPQFLNDDLQLSDDSSSDDSD